MKFNKSIAKRFVILMFICLLYPYFKQRQTLSFIAFIDALTIEGLILLIIGILSKALRSDTFGASVYIIQKKFKKYNKDFDTYLNESNRKIGFNYSLYLGIYCLVLSFILSYFT